VSGKLAMSVLESGLDASLKPAAVVMALHADERGFRIYPSIGRVAWLMGISERAVQVKLSRLRELGVLIPLTRMTGGRGGRVQYQLQLPLTFSRPSWQEKLRSSLRGLVNGEASFRVSEERVKLEAETVKPTEERVKLASAKGEAGFTRSLSDLPVDQKEESATTSELPEGTQTPRASFLELLKASHPTLAEDFVKLKTANGS
jgi:hypothetical protein